MLDLIFLPKIKIFLVKYLVDYNKTLKFVA